MSHPTSAGAALVPALAAPPTPLLAYTASTAGFVAVDPATHIAPLLAVYECQQPDGLPAPAMQGGGCVVPVRGYYEVGARVHVDRGLLGPLDSYGLYAGLHAHEGFYLWADGSPVARLLTGYNAQRLLLEAGSVVHLFVQFSGATARVAGELTLYLLHAA